MRGRKGEQEEERVKIKLDRQDWFPQLGIQSCHLLDNWPCRGTEGRGQVPGVHLPQQKSGLGLPGGELENLKWEAPGQPERLSPLGLTLGGAASTQGCGGLRCEGAPPESPG